MDSKKTKTAQQATSRFNISNEDLNKAVDSVLNKPEKEKTKQGKFTVKDIREILEWLLNRAKTQFTDKNASDEVKTIKREYFNQIKYLLKQLDTVVSGKKRDRDLISPEEINDIINLSFGDHTTRTLPGGSGGGLQQGKQPQGASEEQGRIRSALLNKPFTNSNFLEIHNLLHVYNLARHYPLLLAPNTPSAISYNLLFTPDAKAVSNRLEGINVFEYLSILRQAISGILNAYESYQNREYNRLPDPRESDRATTLINNIRNMMKQTNQ